MSHLTIHFSNYLLVVPILISRAALCFAGRLLAQSFCISFSKPYNLKQSSPPIRRADGTDLWNEDGRASHDAHLSAMKLREDGAPSFGGELRESEYL
jgi:hypothetical protein